MTNRSLAVIGEVVRDFLRGASRTRNSAQTSPNWISMAMHRRSQPKGLMLISNGMNA
jgi:hypothetical protein